MSNLDAALDWSFSPQIVQCASANVSASQSMSVSVNVNASAKYTVPMPLYIVEKIHRKAQILL